MCRAGHTVAASWTVVACVTRSALTKHSVKARHASAVSDIIRSRWGIRVSRADTHHSIFAKFSCVTWRAACQSSAWLRLGAIGTRCNLISTVTVEIHRADGARTVSILNAQLHTTKEAGLTEAVSLKAGTSCRNGVERA